MSDWYRLGLPERAFFLLTLGGVAVLDFTVAGVWLALGRWLEADSLIVSYVPFLGMAVFGCLLMAGFLGLYRVGRYPGCGSQYEAMLLQTPWKPGKRLPFGPWHPMLHDAVPLAVLAIAILLQWGLVRVVLGSHFDSVTEGFEFRELFSGTGIVLIPVALAITFLGSWLVGGCLSLWREFKGAVLWLLLVAGAIVKTWSIRADELAVLMLVATVVVGGMLVVRRMNRLLADLPERGLKQDSGGSKVQVAAEIRFVAPKARAQEMLGIVSQSWPRALLIGAIVAVWVSVFPDGAERYWVTVGVVGVFALARMLIYTATIQSHLGILARWGTRKWIVPQYDRCWLPFFWMLVTALCGIAVAMVVPESIADEVCSFTVGVAVFIGCRSGADFEHWSLTAPCVYGLSRSGGQRRRIEASR